jgi:outer membrane receptor for ferrienterochelin and colicin
MKDLNRLLPLTALIALTATASACGIRPRVSDGPDASKGYIITAETIERSGARTIWDALRLNVKHAMFTEDGHGNPERIRRRGASTISLFEDTLILMDGNRVLDFRLLDRTSAHHIEYLHVLSGIDGTTYYGTNAGDGVIVIYTKDPGADGRGE